MLSPDDHETGKTTGANERPHVKPFDGLLRCGTARSQRLEEVLDGVGLQVGLLVPAQDLRVHLLEEAEAAGLQSAAVGAGGLVLLLGVAVSTRGIALPTDVLVIRERMGEHVDDAKEPATAMTERVIVFLQVKSESSVARRIHLKYQSLSESQIQICTTGSQSCHLLDVTSAATLASKDQLTFFK